MKEPILYIGMNSFMFYSPAQNMLINEDSNKNAKKLDTSPSKITKNIETFCICNIFYLFPAPASLPIRPFKVT